LAEVTERRDQSSESGDVLARLAVAEREIDRLRNSDAAGARVIEISREFHEFKGVVTLKLSEYDKERSLAGRLFWPVIVTLLTAGVLGVVALLLRLNGMLG
jgi:hypothetical protein